MAPKRTVLKSGDILEVHHGDGHTYVSFVGRHGRMGEATWVVPRMYDTRQADPCAVFLHPGFNIFYGVTRALRDGVLTLIGNCLEAVHPVPTVLRYLTNHDADGYVTTSYLSSDGIVCQAVTPHTPDVTDIAIAEIWGHDSLLRRSREGWTPARYQRAQTG